ncbi:MAG: hypothetical protein NVS4B6_22660 [Mycobacterium sp.]
MARNDELAVLARVLTPVGTPVTPLQARRLHVLRTNELERSDEQRKPGIDWLLVVVWVVVGVVSLEVMILAGTSFAALLYAVGERFR